MNLERSLGQHNPPRTNFVDILRYWADHRPDSFAYQFTDAEERHEGLTYTQLLRRVEGLAGYLQSLGATGERVLLFYPPGLEFVIGFYACHAAGAIAVPAFPPRKNRRAYRIRSIALDAQAKFGLSVSSVVEQIHGNSLQSQELSDVKLVATDVPEADRPDLYHPLRIGTEEIALLQYTSGSTGSPKGVVLTHQNLVRNCELITYAFGMRPYQVGLTWLPTYHDMGLVGGILNPMFTGMPNVLMSPMTFLQRPLRWLQAISHYKVAISGGPNFAFQLCVDKISDAELLELDLSSWEFAFNGAEPIRQRTLSAFTERFAPCGFNPRAFLPCYGMAETTLIVTGGPSDQLPVLANFAGKELDQGKVQSVSEGDPEGRSLVGCGEVLPGEVLRIVNSETRELCPDNEIGEIWIQSPCTGQGYYRNAEATEKTFAAFTACDQGPFLRTGDLGFMHDGQLFVTGRIKDMIIVRGVNRYPQDIEQTVERASSAVQTGAVAAVSLDLDGREQLMIVAETVRQRGLDWDAEIAAIRRAVTAEHELPPDGVFLVRNSSVPKTSSGKIQRHACHQAILQRDLKLVAYWTREEALGNSLISGKGVGGGMVMQAAGNSSQAGERERSAPVARLMDEGSVDRDGGASNEVVAIVIAHVKSVAKERAGELTRETDIVLDLGLDSLERLEIAHSLEQAFGGRFPEETLQEIETVEEVAAAIEFHMGSEAIQKAVRMSGSPVANGKLGAANDSDTSTAETSLAQREIPADEYQFDQFPEYRRLRETIAQVQLTGVPNPYFSVHEGTVRDTTKIGGRELISFASYNYLGLSGDPVVNQAAEAAIETYGTSVSASRLVSGEKPLHGELEHEIADFIGVDNAIALVGGHSTNETVIGHLVGPGDLILHDALSHNSIVQGAVLSGARRRPFPHNDFQALDQLLTQLRGQYRRVLVVVEGTYSMDGDFPELPEFIRVKQAHRCLLMVDEAHSIGTLGNSGRGIGEHFGVDPREVDVWMGTLSKSFASCGGYIAGSDALIELLKYTAPGFVFSVGIPPSATAAALAAIRQLRAEPERVVRLQQRSAQFLRRAKACGFDTGASGGTPVIPIITGNSLVALRLSHRLFQDGINVQPILYPAVEEAAARLRFFITSEHSPLQIETTIAALARHGADLGLIAVDEMVPRRLPGSINRNAMGA
ncbi:aminotransferase class I/II-fold pyridoxal phosphate-dependent enzyme [Planctomycetaceae bacterium SH139]